MRKSIKIILPVILVGLTIYALDWFAVINVQKMLHNVPVVGKIIPAPRNEAKQVSGSTTTDKETQALKNENLNLKKQLKDLKKQTEELKKANSDLKIKQEQQLLSDQNTQAKQQEVEQQESGYKVLATYYAEMKPANAVAIMNNLDDDTIIGILTNMDSEQSGKILAAMDPKRAAEIVQKMT